ncbi:MAG: hypothetical protein IPP29_18730 [Bacteroidetes bacterium]|nr:hypothetical protein [Bacteroidota bacterium]
MFIAIANIHAQQNEPRFINLGRELGRKSSSANCAIKDRQGYVWIGTNNGLYRYNGYEFNGYFYEPDDSSSLSSNHVQCLFQDINGMIWIGTGRGGMNLFNPVTEKNTRYKIFTGDSLDPTVRTVQTIYLDKNNTLWIGTESRGIFKINSNRKIVKHINLVDKQPERHTKRYYENSPQHFLELENEQMLVSTLRGLFHLTKKRKHATA